MSFLATAPRRAAPGLLRATRSAFAARRTAGTDIQAAVVLATSFLLITFVTTGGSSLAPNTAEEVVLLGIGLVSAVALLFLRVEARPWGAVTFALFGLLTLLTGLSIAWSVQPDHSWVESSRTLSYLAGFGVAVALARLFPRRWSAVIGAVATFTAVVSLYALVAKVFPAALDRLDFLGRLSAPFDYWNATGVVAAMGLAPAVWAGARADRARSLRALAVPAIAIELTVVVLSYSRSAVVAAVVGLAVWFALVPLRLRGALFLALGGLGGLILSAWALATHALTHDHVPLAARSSAGHGFGVLLVLVLVAGTGLGLVAAFAGDRVSFPLELRRRVGRALLGLVALVPVAGVLALFLSSRGFSGEVSHIWNTLTSAQAHVGDNPGRLVQLGNSRPLYWSEGFKVAEHALVHGVGAAGYATARTRYTTDPLVVGHAHSYVIQTFADFGLLGLAVNLALLVAWVLAAARTLGMRRLAGLGRLRLGGRFLAGEANAGPSERRLPGAEQAALLTLLAVVLAYGVQSLVDWTWFFPGGTLPVLFCAGWLAGRGPVPEPPSPTVRHPAAHPGRSLTAVTLAVLTLLGAWAVWQPLRAQDAESAAVVAATSGQTGRALQAATAAAARDPLSVDPLFERAALLGAEGDRHAAHAELVRALELQPENPATWTELGLFDLQNGLPHAAIGVLRRAHELDRSSTLLAQAIPQAKRETAARLKR